jgi:hypothetical protein
MPGGISNASLASGAAPLAGKTIIAVSNLNFTPNTTTTLYTVTAGKTFYLLYAWLQINSTADGQNGTLDAGAAGNTILRLGAGLTGTYNIRIDKSTTITFPYPIPYAAATTFRVTSTHANLYPAAGIIGWEE